MPQIYADQNSGGNRGTKYSSQVEKSESERKEIATGVAIASSGRNFFTTVGREVHSATWNNG
jgi:hypothetical protein